MPSRVDSLLAYTSLSRAEAFDYEDGDVAVGYAKYSPHDDSDCEPEPATTTPLRGVKRMITSTLCSARDALLLVRRQHAPRLKRASLPSLRPIKSMFVSRTRSASSFNGAEPATGFYRMRKSAPSGSWDGERTRRAACDYHAYCDNENDSQRGSVRREECEYAVDYARALHGLGGDNQLETP